MGLSDLERLVRVCCPHCLQADWRTRAAFQTSRAFTCYACLSVSEQPATPRGRRQGCAARLTRLFLRGSDGASA